MTAFLIKPYRWAACLSIVLTLAFVFVLLDSFVIPKEQEHIAPPPETEENETELSVLKEPLVTNTSYEDENIKISIEALRENGTDFYVADIRITDAAYLRTALAKNSFGRNIKETTSETAQANNAIFAVNGDYYGFRDTGFVLRNGVLYRETGSGRALVIDGEGNFSVADEDDNDAKSFMDNGAWQILSFGPALVESGEIVVGASSETSKSLRSNPRTAIGQVSQLHYIVIVSDGRTKESKGFSLLELAREFDRRGCTVAYNLDGGGSSAMYFNGRIINNPTDGRKEGERTVSDIVYIGYQ